MNQEEVKVKAIATLKTVFDPEIPVNVVDLGLIREIKLENGVLKVRMTMTAPGCPYYQVLAQMVRDALKAAIPELKDVEVEIEWYPPWTPFDMTPEGREEFKRRFGYDIADNFIKRYGSVENYYKIVRQYLGIKEPNEKTE